MSAEQREAIKSWSTNFMRIMLGISSFSLVGLYVVIEKNRDYEREEFKRSIDKIESNTTEMTKDVNTIKNSVNLIEYRLDRVEKNQP